MHKENELHDCSSVRLISTCTRGGRIVGGAPSPSPFREIARKKAKVEKKGEITAIKVIICLQKGQLLQILHCCKTDGGKMNDSVV